MDVLKAIHTNGSFIVGSEKVVEEKCSSSLYKAGGEELVESDDEALAVKKRNQFENRLATFSYGSSSSHTKQANVRHITTPLQHSLPSSDDDEPLLLSKTSAMKAQPNKAEAIPKLSETLIPILRGFVNCPLCLEPFPNLSLEETNSPTNTKTKKKKKIQRVKKVQTGPERLTHLEICAFRNETSEEIVMSLITRERIRLDRNIRNEYNEEVYNQGMWKTLTGDEPPSTQVQRDAIKKGRRKAKVPNVKKGNEVVKKGKGSKSKLASTSALFKAGKRGGLSRASTTILAPHLTRMEVKQKCIELFGPPQRVDEVVATESNIWSLYDHHDENTTRSIAARSKRTILLGLGVGTCSQKVEETDSNGAIARLGMGNTLGLTIAQRCKPSA